MGPHKTLCRLVIGHRSQVPLSVGSETSISSHMQNLNFSLYCSNIFIYSLFLLFPLEFNVNRVLSDLGFIFCIKRIAKYGGRYIFVVSASGLVYFSVRQTNSSFYFGIL